MGEHTKGPWKATKFNPVTGAVDDCYLYVEPGIAVIERKVKGRDQNDAANALLIAAAPDLLEALVYARRFLRKADHDTDYVDAIIARAKGEE